MTSINRLSWSETSFRKKRKLLAKSYQKESEKLKSLDRYERARGYSALSSTCYSIAGTGMAQLRNGWYKIWWYPLVLYCYSRMLDYSDKVVQEMGYDAMTAEMCDIRQSILRKRGKWEKAEECIDFALKKEIKHPHTVGLLFVGLAEIHLARDKKFDAEAAIELAIYYAKDSEEYDLRQAARIYKQCGQIVVKVDTFYEGPTRSELPTPAWFAMKARELAEETGAKDQLLKQS